MYNDQIMACCLLATIYFVAESMPTAAMIMFNLGLSIKIGVFLLLPSLLGQLQYRYGVGMLLKFALSVYVIQKVLCIPFMICPDEYFTSSRIFGHAEWYASKHAAVYEHTYYWGFLPKEIYESDELISKVRLATMVLNVYVFFVMQNSLYQCLHNLFHSPDQDIDSPALTHMSKFDFDASTPITYAASSLTYAYRLIVFQAINPLLRLIKRLTMARSNISQVERDQKCIENMVLGLLIGATFVPGGHEQFMAWYVHLIPLAIEMIGLPHLATFWIYQTFYPGLYEKEKHHLANMAIIAILLIVGTIRKAMATSDKK